MRKITSGRQNTLEKQRISYAATILGRLDPELISFEVLQVKVIKLLERRYS
jgi:hypothetical protein